MNSKIDKLGYRSSRLFKKSLGRRGSATLEMAVCGMFLFLVTFGCIEWGYALYTKNQVMGAAREGARSAIVSGATTSDVNAAVTNTLNVAGLRNTATVVITPSLASVTTGTAITVTVDYNWGNGLGLGAFSRISSNHTIECKATMRRE